MLQDFSGGFVIDLDGAFAIGFLIERRSAAVDGDSVYGPETPTQGDTGGTPYLTRAAWANRLETRVANRVKTSDRIEIASRHLK